MPRYGGKRSRRGGTCHCRKSLVRGPNHGGKCARCGGSIMDVIKSIGSKAVGFIGKHGKKALDIGKSLLSEGKKLLTTQKGLPPRLDKYLPKPHGVNPHRGFRDAFKDIGAAKAQFDALKSGSGRKRRHYKRRR